MYVNRIISICVYLILALNSEVVFGSLSNSCSQVLTQSKSKIKENIAFVFVKKIFDFQDDIFFSYPQLRIDLEKIKNQHALNQKFNNTISIETTIFSYLIEQRIKDFSPDDQKALKEIIENRSFEAIQGVPKSYNSRVPYLLGNQIKIGLTPDYKNTILDFYITTHEIEHFIQTYQNNHSKSFITRQRDEDIPHFYSEKMSMIAEFNYLKLLPYELINKTINEIKSDERILPYYKQIYIAAFKGASLSLEHYLNRMWFVYKRYSPPNNATVDLTVNEPIIKGRPSRPWWKFQLF